MDGGKRYVRLDEHGVWRVGATRVMLDSVVVGFQQGQSPETIQQSYPALSLEEVYGAITHYLGHQPEIDDYLRRQAAVWEGERARAAALPNPVATRLRKLRSEAATREQ